MQYKENIMEMDKKRIERQYLDAFIRLYSEFPKGRIISGESPDFVVKTRRWTIGIELTELIVQPPSSTSAKLIRDWQQSFMQELEKTVKKKEEKLRLYQRDNHLKYCLLIHFDLDISTLLRNLPATLNEKNLESGFDAIFIFCPKQQFCQQLNPSV